MKVMIAYDGSTYADAALDDLRRAGLPREAEALIVSVGDGLVSCERCGAGVPPKPVPRGLVRDHDGEGG